jgi:hypothetical protein
MTVAIAVSDTELAIECDEPLESRTAAGREKVVEPWTAGPPRGPRCSAGE